MYRQCSMRKGTTWQTAFIPAELAKRGNFLEIKGDNGWMVEFVGGKSDGQYLTSDGRGYRGEFGSLR